MIEYRTLKNSWFGGWVIQKKTPSHRYWFFPEEETTYGVLDSQVQAVYRTKDDALARITALSEKQQ